MIAARRPYGFIFPLVLVIGGALILLANVGALPEDAGWRLLQLWPVLLVMLGVQLLVPHLFDRAVVPAVTLAVVGALAIGSFAYAVAGPSLGGGSYTRAEVSAPAAGLNAGTITIEAAGAQVNIRAGDVGDVLYQAKVDYTGSEPRISQEFGDLRITAGQNNIVYWAQRPTLIDLALSASANWTVKVDGAGTTTKIDFTEGQLHSLTVNGVGGSVSLLAGDAKGTVPISLSGVGTAMTVNLNAGTEYRVTGKGIGTSVDGKGQTAGWETAADRYDVSANGVGARVTVRVPG